MKENNINQVTMDEAVEVNFEETERKGIIARAKEKVQDFGEKHPKVVKTIKGVGIVVLAVGAYALGKAAVTVDTEETCDEPEFEGPVEDVDFVEVTEE